MNEIILRWRDLNGSHSLALTGDKTITIGRSPDCSIVFSDKKISRIHAAISVQDDDFQLTNLSQINAVHLKDDQHLTTGQSTPLTPGIAFRIGPILFTVHLNTAGEHMVTCSHCGHNVPSRLKNCHHCGYSLAGGLTVIDWEEVIDHEHWNDPSSMVR